MYKKTYTNLFSHSKINKSFLMDDNAGVIILTIIKIFKKLIFIINRVKTHHQVTMTMMIPTKTTMMMMMMMKVKVTMDLKKIQKRR